MSGLEDKELVKEQYLSFSRYPKVVKQALNDLFEISREAEREAIIQASTFWRNFYSFFRSIGIVKEPRTKREAFLEVFYLFSYVFQFTIERLEDINEAKAQIEGSKSSLSRTPVLAHEYTMEVRCSLERGLLENYTLAQIKTMSNYLDSMTFDGVTEKLEKYKDEAGFSLPDSENGDASDSEQTSSKIKRSFGLVQVFDCLKGVLYGAQRAIREAQRAPAEIEEDTELANLLMHPQLPFGVTSSVDDRRRHSLSLKQARDRQFSLIVSTPRSFKSSFESILEEDDDEKEKQEEEGASDTEQTVQTRQEPDTKLTDLFQENTESLAEKNCMDLSSIEQWMLSLAFIIKSVGYIGLLSALGLLNFIGIVPLVGLTLLGFAGFLLLMLIGLRIYCEIASRPKVICKIEPQPPEFTPAPLIVEEGLIAKHFKTLDKLVGEEKPSEKKALIPPLPRKIPRRKKTPSKGKKRRLDVDRASPRPLRGLSIKIDHEVKTPDSKIESPRSADSLRSLSSAASTASPAGGLPFELSFDSPLNLHSQKLRQARVPKAGSTSTSPFTSPTSPRHGTRVTVSVT